MSSQKFKRPEGRAEEMSAPRKVTPRMNSEKPEKQSSKNTDKVDVTEDPSSVGAKPAESPTTEPQGVTVTTHVEGGNGETTSSQTDTMVTPNEVPIEKSVEVEEKVEEIPLIEPKEEQVKLTSFNNERLNALKDALGVQYKKEAVGLLLDIAEGLEPQLEGRAKKHYDLVMNNKKEIFELNNWKMTK